MALSDGKILKDQRPRMSDHEPNSVPNTPQDLIPHKNPIPFNNIERCAL